MTETTRQNTNPVPVDPGLYATVKKQVYARYPTHSAYRSGHLVREYKERFAEKHGARKRPYRGSKPSKADGGLKRWFAEEWVNESGEIGYDKKNTLYRPSKRVTDRTPATWDELSKKDVRTAKREKKATGRVKRFAA